VLQRINGWWDKRFDLPDSFFALRKAPAQVLLARPLDAMEKLLPAAGYLSCAILDSLSADFLQSSRSIWLRVLAHLVLSRKEQGTWQELWARRRNDPPLDWLLGRCVVKDAVRLLLRRGSTPALCPADIEIENGPGGDPRLSEAWAGTWGEPPLISLSHKGDVAVALAGSARHLLALGIDVESIDQLGRDVIEDAFSASEQRLINAFELTRRQEIAARFWCAREAMAKALGQGLQAALNEFEVTGYDDSTGEIDIRISTSLRKPNGNHGARPFISTLTLGNEFVAAAVIIMRTR
jgi:phosphopantetheine--protein transferase-like protein